MRASPALFVLSRIFAVNLLDFRHFLVAFVLFLTDFEHFYSCLSVEFGITDKVPSRVRIISSSAGV